MSSLINVDHHHAKLLLLIARFQLYAKRYENPCDRVIERDVHHEFHDAAIVEEAAQRVEGRVTDLDVLRRLDRIAHHRPFMLIEQGRRREVGEVLELLALHPNLERDVPVMDEFVFGAGQPPDGHEREFAQLRIELRLAAQFTAELEEAAEEIRRVGDGAKDVSDGRTGAILHEPVENVAVALRQIFTGYVRKSRGHVEPPHLIRNKTFGASLTPDFANSPNLAFPPKLSRGDVSRARLELSANLTKGMKCGYMRCCADGGAASVLVDGDLN